MAETKSLFDGLLKNIEFAFTWTGLSLESRKRSSIDTIRCRFVFIFNFIWLNSDIVGAVSWFIEGIENGKTITELTYLFPCTTLSFLASMKSVYHIKKEDLVNQIVEDMRTLEEKGRDKINDKIEVIINKEVKFLKFVTTLLNTLNVMMVAVFTSSPLILITIKYVKTGTLELMLPFLDVYPFDPYDMRLYPFLYIKQIWSECVVLLEICATDYFFYTCCTYIRVQFLLLQQDIEELIPCKRISVGVIKYDEDVRRKFLDLVIWHQQLISSAEMLEVIYAKSTLMNFLISSIIICLTGFNVTTITDIAFIVIFMTFLFMGLLQVFFFCYFGDLLMRSSMELNDSIYNCRWYLMDSSFGKDLQFMQKRSQKPCKLTAWGFADVNLRAFMRVLSSSWSYFALLKTVYSAQRS
ncbi:putative odorant receptor 92a [Amyelois transitella]|uniref:putative odorant receptor 92a n=1 Tax=Amyelois transitella TaxID=680683 RepID=UPI00298F8813|nr:putative odorant receptor 92a [Amyelois transitella]